ncbi:MAG: hypothetical protein OXE99_13830 [Cellvibrionales bacterium]|nr:hypothetical protein [Cellvibrionales bacterium]
MNKNFITSAVIGTSLVLTACNNDNNGSFEPSANTGVLQTVASDYSSSSIQLIGLDNEVPTVSSSQLTDTRSDYIVKGYKDNYYYIGRNEIDTMTRLNTADIVNPELTFDTGEASDGESANVHDLVFASDEKAYMIRYGDTKIWIVNPKAADQENFKIGEIDISAYADDDGKPEATSGAIVDGKLFVAMQRLDFNDDNTPAKEGQNAYVAVFNVANDTEIDTNLTDDEENLKGIELSVRNPALLTTSEDGSLYLVAKGDIYSSYYSDRAPGYIGGIIEINTQDYSTSMIIDDGDDENHPYGYIDNATIIDANNGYFSGYFGWKDNSLYHFNPTTGEVTGAVANIENTNITLLDTSPAGNAWVGIGIAEDPHVIILNSVQEALHRLSLAKNPNTVTFVYQAEEDDFVKLREETEEEVTEEEAAQPFE